jgi:hypothetical protein
VAGVTRRENSPSAGLLPVKGTYGDIRIGSLIQGYKARNDDVWEVIDMRTPEQFDHSTSPWFRAVNKASGEKVSIPPKSLHYPCMFMVPEETVDPDEEKPKLDPDTVGPHRPLSDQEAVDLLVKELGASEIATKDHETGIVTCPPYEQGMFPRHEYLAHLEVAHGIDTSGIVDAPIEQVVTIHGEAHSKNWTNPRPWEARGFPHQHGYADSGKPFGNLK